MKNIIQKKNDNYTETYIHLMIIFHIQTSINVTNNTCQDKIKSYLLILLHIKLY